MKESVTYQAILEEGEAKGEATASRRILLRLGRKHLGQPSPEILAAIEATMDTQRLESLADRISDVSTWRELLAEA